MIALYSKNCDYNQHEIYAEQIYKQISAKEVSAHAKSAYLSCIRFINVIPKAHRSSVFTAVLLHDIGKDIEIHAPEHHAIIGYNALDGKVSELCRYLVLTHTDSEIVLREFDFLAAKFKLYNQCSISEKLNLNKMKSCVALADLTSSHEGGIVSFTERLKSIEERHGDQLSANLQLIFYNACKTLGLDYSEFK